MKAYIDELNKIKLFINLDIVVNDIKVISKTNIFTPSNKNIERDNFEQIISLYFDEYLPLNIDLNVLINDTISISCLLGYVTKTPIFNEIYYTDLELGAIYSKEKTIFRVFTPVAKELILVLDDKKYPMHMIDNSCYELSINKDVLNKQYYYLVRVNDTFKKCIDPYSFGVTNNATSSIVLDYPNNIEKVNIKSNKLIYEASIRDLTSYYYEGTYLDMFNHPKIINHLKDLNISHIEFLPTYNFGGVDETNYQTYNWGYNPVSYFSVSNYLANKKGLGTITRLELINTINKLHKENIGVIFDVVYNHVYETDNFAYEILVPGYSYFYHMNSELYNASWCGNDLNTTHKMIRKLIIDNMIYLIKVFNIDGFRFDLMGNIDSSLIEEAKEKVLSIKKDVLFFGEGWDMKSCLNEKGLMQSNALLHPDIGFFNDTFRNTIRGNARKNQLGFITDAKISKEDLFNIFTGSSNKYNNPLQSINYIECHDNLTLCDCIKYLNKNSTNLEIIDKVKLGLAFTILSFGIPFISGGMELLRSKKMCDNSYNKSDFINMINWSNLNLKNDLTSFIKNINDVKKDISLYVSNDYKYILNNIKTLDYIESFNVLLENKYLFIFKNNNNIEKVKLFNYECILNDKVLTNNKDNLYALANIGVYIFELKK